MSDVPSPKNAIISAHDKLGLVGFGERLLDHGFRIYGSSGTVELFQGAKLPVEHTAALLAQYPCPGEAARKLPREMHAAMLAGLIQDPLLDPSIDLVCGNLKPFTVPETPFSDEVSQIDLGGKFMLEAAAKMRKIVICDPSQYAKVKVWLDDGQPDDIAYREILREEAYKYTSVYGHPFNAQVRPTE